MTIAPLLMLLGLGATSVVPEPVDVTRLTFARVDGIPGAQTITQTADGWLWFGGPRGLERFDGRTFSSVSGPWNVEPVRQLQAGTDGTLWVVTGRADVDTSLDVVRINWSARTNDLFRGRIDAGQVRNWEKVEGLNDVWTLAVSPEGGVVASTRRGLYRIGSDLTLSSLSPPVSGDREALALAFEPTGALLAAGSWGLWRYAAGRAPEILSSAPVMALSVGAGRTLISEGKHLRISGTAEAWNFPSPVSTLLADRSGLWAVSGWGLLRLSQPDRQTQLPWFSGKAVRALFQDREGTVWVGTWGTGVFRSMPKLVTAPRLDSEAATAVFSVLASRDGSLWFTSTAGLGRIQVDGSMSYVSLKELDVWSIRGIAELAEPSAQGALLVAADYFGLLRGDAAHFTVHTPPWKGKRANVLMVHALSHGGAALSFRDGGVRILSRDDLERTQPFDSGVDLELGKGLCAGNVSAAATTQSGFTFFTHDDGGISSWDGNQARCYREALPGSEPVSLQVDPAGGLWVGFSDPVGLGHLDETGRIKMVPPGSGLGRVFAIAQDDQDRLWLTSDQGVSVLRLSDVRRALLDGKAPPAALHVGLSEGLPSEDCVARFQPGIARMRDGRMAVPTLSGLALVEPTLPRQRPALTTVLEHVRIRGNSIVPRDKFQIGSDDAPIELTFTAPTSVRPETIRFEYREGTGSNWYLIESGRTLHLASLAPGTQTLQARAVDPIIGTSGSTVEIVFDVKPPWWRRPITLVAIGLLLFAIGVGTARLRLHQFRLQVLAVNRERQRLARELHDGLAQGFASIGIHLTAIGNRAAREAPELVPPLQQTQNVVAECSNQARNAIWNLRSLSASLSLSDAVKAAIDRWPGENGKAKPIFVEVGKARPCKVELLYELPLVAQEAVVNAIKHGNASRIEVRLEYAASTITLTVTDDGQGLPVNGAPSPVKGHGFGITGMKERVARLSGAFSLASAPGRGTRLQVSIPNTAIANDEQDGETGAHRV